MKAAAEKYPVMDLSRVGIYGGSAGGQNAVAALIWHGDFYQVAVADCGCHGQSNGQGLVERAVDGIPDRRSLRSEFECRECSFD